MIVTENLWPAKSKYSIKLFIEKSLVIPKIETDHFLFGKIRLRNGLRLKKIITDYYRRNIASG